MAGHRATLKQSNKPFKSRHATKGELKSNNKGKLGVSHGGGGERSAPALTNNQRGPAKADRRNAARIEQLKKRAEVTNAHRLFTGDRNGVPKIISVVSLCADISSRDIVRQFFASEGQELDEASMVLRMERFKQRWQFLPIDRSTHNVFQALDLIKVTDVAVFALSAKEQVDDLGQEWLSAIKAQYVPTNFSVVAHLESQAAKQHAEIRKSLQSFMAWQWPESEEHRVASMGAPKELQLLCRLMHTARPKPAVWRDRYAYLRPDAARRGDAPGQLLLTGYLRGQSMTANGLVHLPGVGDFQLAEIRDAAAGPGEGTVLHAADEMAREDLEAELDPDESDEGEHDDDVAEEEEVMDEGGAILKHSTRKVLRRVPKGTSGYQAAWLSDDGEDEDDDDVDEYGAGKEQQPLELALNSLAVQDSRDADEEKRPRVTFAAASDDEDDEEEGNADYIDEAAERAEDRERQNEFTREEDDEQYASLRAARRAQEAEEQLSFPDEVDTPRDEPARTRFRRYKGAKSLRFSEWDAREDLPADYGRIWEFENWARFQKAAQRRAERGRDAGAVPAGRRVTLVVAGVSDEDFALLDAVHNVGSAPWASSLTVWAILPHEQRMSVLNFALTRPSDGAGETLKSKDALTFMVGFRRYTVRPMFSQHAQGRCHKFERYFARGSTVVATAYAPVQYAPAHVCCFDPASGALVATGTLLSADPSRIVLKRIVLTGYPYKVNRRSAVIRFMFFNPEDVEWFKPMQLTTKLGRVGHIKMPLGTHGYMKCEFDTQIRQTDTVCMNLYKRVFPRWTPSRTLYRLAGVPNADASMT